MFNDAARILDPRRTALLLIDMQNDFVSPAGHFASHGADLSIITPVVSRTKGLLEIARSAGVFAVFVHYTELPHRLSYSFSQQRRRYKPGVDVPYCLEGTWGHSYPDDLAPREGEAIVNKLRGSSYTGTFLDSILRTRDIRTVAIAGVVTEGCIYSAAQESGAHDFCSVIVDDCVGSFDRQMHEAALMLLQRREDCVTHTELAELWTVG